MSKSGFYAMFRTKRDLHRHDLAVESDCRMVTRIQTLDEVCLALKEAFDFTVPDFEKFREAYKKAHRDVCETTLLELEDSNNDATYAFALLDRAIEDAVGSENFAPYYERYNSPDNDKYAIIYLHVDREYAEKHMEELETKLKELKR